MISGLKKEYPKASKSVLQKAQYEQKNSNVILKRNFKGYKNLAKVYLNFKKNIDVFKKKTFLVAVSGGPDSLALVALTKAYQFEKKSEFFYVLINHNIRKNSSKEAKQVQILLKKYNIRLNILLNKKKLLKIYKVRLDQLDIKCY